VRRICFQSGFLKTCFRRSLRWWNGPIDVHADADHRTLAGLSLGGEQALSIGLAYADLFHYILGFSGAVGSPFMNAKTEFGQTLSKSEVLNSKFRLLWVSCGKQDFLYQANRQFVDMLNSKGVKVQFRETEGSH
jgi:enterochelin esterase-like enzyme